MANEVYDLDDLIAEGDEPSAQLGSGGNDDTGPEAESEEVPLEGAPDAVAGELVDDDVFDEPSEDEQDEPSEDEALEDEESDSPTPGEADPRDTKIAQLESYMAQQGQMLQALQAQLAQGQQQKQQRHGPDQNVRAALDVLLSGGDIDTRKQQLLAMPPYAVRAAQEELVRHQNRESSYVLDPVSRYRDQSAQFVEAHVRKLLEPVYDFISKGTVQDVLQQHQALLSRPGAREGVKAELAKLPLDGWSPQERMAAAATLYSAKAERREAGKKRKKVESQEKDLQALKEARRGRGRGRSRRGKKKAPELNTGWDVKALAAQIRQDDAIDEDEIRLMLGDV